jgi:FkbM family methyltransferase
VEKTSLESCGEELNARRSMGVLTQLEPQKFLAPLFAMSNLTLSAPKSFRCEFTGLCVQSYSTANWDTNQEDPELVEHFAAVPTQPSEDAFEMASLVSALISYTGAGTAKRRPFVMVDLGAGYGRWALNAVKLGERLGAQVRAIVVEAEPTHFRMLQDAFASAGVDVSPHRLIFAAAGGTDGPAFFFTGAASRWWGQRLLGSWVPPPSPGEWGGEAGGEEAETVETDVLSLGRILEGEEEVDLVDMDIQGAELEVLGAALHEVHPARLPHRWPAPVHHGGGAARRGRALWSGPGGCTCRRTATACTTLSWAGSARPAGAASSPCTAAGPTVRRRTRPPSTCRTVTRRGCVRPATQARPARRRAGVRDARAGGGAGPLGHAPTPAAGREVRSHCVRPEVSSGARARVRGGGSGGGSSTLIWVRARGSGAWGGVATYLRTVSVSIGAHGFRC